MTLDRVSTGTGGTGNTDACDPSGNSKSPDDWNTYAGGPTDCSVLDLSGGGGVSAGDGTIYFVSPEKLDGSGTEGAPNLFVARPGAGPKHVATLASSANFPFAPEEHLLEYETGGFSSPAAANFDYSNGKYYVMDNTAVNRQDGPFIQRYKPDGSLDLSFASNGKLNGSETPNGPFHEIGNNEAQGVSFPVTNTIGFDNTCYVQEKSGAECEALDPSNGSLYVPDITSRKVIKFDKDGNYLSEIDLTPILGTINVEARAVAVDPRNGNVIILTGGDGALIYDNQEPNVFTGKEFNSAGHGNLTIDGEGYIYTTNGNKNGTRKWMPDGVSFENWDLEPVSGLSWDPSTNHIYVDKEGNRIEEYTTTHEQVSPTFGEGVLENSVGLAAFNDRIVISNRGDSYAAGKFSVFGPLGIPPNPKHDNPLVIHGVQEGNTRHTEDLQITSDGDVAAFGSALKQINYDPRGKIEIFRYDAPKSESLCVSCNPTNAVATGEHRSRRTASA